MPAVFPQTTLDPLNVFTTGAFTKATQTPLPLVAAEFDVTIDAGLTAVVAKRRFRNAEPASIEATITFPIPVHAVLFSLKAKIADRILEAKAQTKKAARTHYEDAIERGKTAVLHEEVLRGVHMLSVGHIPPGAEIEVEAAWAMTLIAAGEACTLRIPLTAGDIYGRSPLPDCDDLITGGPLQMAKLSAACPGGMVRLLNGELHDGSAQVPLNAPIDLEVRGVTPADLYGRAANGRLVVMRIEPLPAVNAPLNAALLIDRSGSMGEACFAGAGSTKHESLIAALRASANEFRDGDSLEIWEFADGVNLVGRAGDASKGGERFDALTGKLQLPGGGTEIGSALRSVIAESGTRDILVITDGKSYALDVHELARQGRRIQVILIGADSLEANIGHLAALTGGEIFVAAGEDLNALFAAALRSLRTPAEFLTPAAATPDRVSTRRAGMCIEAQWMEAVSGRGAGNGVIMRAVPAVAASLALSAISEEAAAELAEQEGLVTHLTSLVLFDEAGKAQAGIPATRKVALPRAIGSASLQPVPAGRPRGRASFAVLDAEFEEPHDVIAPESFPRKLRSPATEDESLFSRLSILMGFDDLARNIPWEKAPRELQTGNLNSAGTQQAHMIRLAARMAIITGVAAKLNLRPVVLLIGLLARSQAEHSRPAARIARAIFGKVTPAEADEVGKLLGLAGQAPRP